MRRVVLAANNAEVGGGEVMLLAAADIIARSGRPTLVVGPDARGGVLDEAEAEGHEVVRFPGNRREYMTALRRWHRTSGDVLWCHGLVPALATAGRRRRIVHLHQAPSRAHRVAIRLARAGADVALVPSSTMARVLPGTHVMWNWTHAVREQQNDTMQRPVRVGFIGRHSHDKGLDVLGDALAALDSASPGAWRLVLAGDGRFVPENQVARVRQSLARISAFTETLGWCGRDEFFDQIDIAVFPSTWAEPFGLVAAEAMSARVPVVVSDAGALPEVVGPDHPWVCRADDSADLSRVIALCAGAPDEFRRQSTDRAFIRWSDSFSPAAGEARVRAVLSAFASQDDEPGPAAS